MKKRIAAALAAFLCLCGLTACSGQENGLQNGYYTAQAAEFSHGWKEFVTITVRGGRITAVGYNAINESGFVKSWDNDYMNAMKSVTGTYPNEYTRSYAAQMLERQDADIDAISGATSSAGSFRKLAEAVLDQSRQGNSQTVIVDTAE